MMGLEGLLIVTSPMAGNLEDLHEISKRVILAKPWRYDHTCVPLPWQTVNLRDEGRKLKWGVIWEDCNEQMLLKRWSIYIGTIPPSPACKRALNQVISALKKQGHEVVDFQPPNVWEGLNIGYELVFSGGGPQIKSALSPNETITPAAKSILDLLQLPRILKKILSFFIRSKDPMASQLYNIMHPKTCVQDRQSIMARDVYRAEWHEKWTEEGLDFVLTVPHAFPALENGSSEQTLMSAGYTLLFNLASFFSASRNEKKRKLTFSNKIARLHRWCTPSYLCP